MCKWSIGICAVSLLGFVSQADAQSYAELLQENERLKAQVLAFESRGLDPHDHHLEHRHQHEHDEHHETGSHDEAFWQFYDPYEPGWWLPSDEYRPYSWAPPPNEGFMHDLLFGQFVETHRSPGGTPWVHPFTIEPPQLHRDAFFIYKYTNDAEGGPVDEHEMEVHLDWGLTRRFGILLAAPYLGLDSPDQQATGFGDLEIAPRVVFVESESFFLSANILMTVPTGDDTRDLGAGEMTMAPYLTTWNDLGCCPLPWTNWNTLFVNFGPELGLESGDTTLSYTAVFAHSILGPKLLLPHQHGSGTHGESNHAGHDAVGGTISAFGPMAPVGLTNFILELNGQTELQGEQQTLLQLLTGFSYVLTECAELRFGVNFPLNRTNEQMDVQYTFAFTQIF